MANVKRNTFHLGTMDQVEWFYNRRPKVQGALATLREKGNVEVVGPRKIGKTWFLRYISDSTVLQEHDIDPQHSLFVYMDCQRHLGQQEKAQVYRTMLERVLEMAQQTGLDLTAQSWDDYEAKIAFELVLKELCNREIGVILLLDEFEEMARNSELNEVFFKHLRALTGADDVNIAYVTSSLIPLVDLCQEHESLVSSRFFNIFQPIRLGLFNEQDSQHLVEDSLRKASTCFPSELMELVLEMGGGHPFFLQMAGDHAFKLTVTGEELTENQRKAFLERVNEAATGHFKYYWWQLDHQEQHVLANLSLLEQDQSHRETLKHLKDRCLITQRNDQYEYFSPLFETFVRQQSISDMLQAGPLLIDQRTKRAFLQGEPLSLSSKNYELLICLLERVGQVVSYEDLWLAGWSGEPYNLVEQVKSSISRLRSALEDDAVRIVNRRGVGYMLEIPPE